jgi:hypothetical protein
MSILVSCFPDPSDRYPYMMTSDESLEELFSFALLLGMKSHWLKMDDGMPHFIISDRKRKEAIDHGAVKSSMREITTAASKIAKNSMSLCQHLCNPARPAEGNRTPGFPLSQEEL